MHVTHTGTHGGTLARQVRDSRAYVPTPTPTPTPTKTVQQPAGLDLREEPEKGPQRLAEPDAARRRSARAARGGSFTESDFRRLCALMRQEAAARAFETEDALVAHVQRCAGRLGLLCPPDALERLAIVAGRERETHEAAWRERCTRAGHRPRCQSADHCTLRILRRSIGPDVTLEMAREWRAAKEGR